MEGGVLGLCTPTKTRTKRAEPSAGAVCAVKLKLCASMYCSHHTGCIAHRHGKLACGRIRAAFRLEVSACGDVPREAQSSRCRIVLCCERRPRAPLRSALVHDHVHVHDSIHVLFKLHGTPMLHAMRHARTTCRLRMSASHLCTCSMLNIDVVLEIRISLSAAAIKPYGLYQSNGCGRRLKRLFDARFDAALWRRTAHWAKIVFRLANAIAPSDKHEECSSIMFYTYLKHMHGLSVTG